MEHAEELPKKDDHHRQYSPSRLGSNNILWVFVCENGEMQDLICRHGGIFKRARGRPFALWGVFFFLFHQVIFVSDHLS